MNEFLKHLEPGAVTDTNAGGATLAALSLAMSMKRIADAICGDPQNTGIHKAILDLSDAWGRK